VGIDGSGKSALVQRLQTRFASAPNRLVAFTCPSFHNTPDAPLAGLSVQLKVLSNVADELRSFELKLATLYLRMTLYGPVERFFRQTFAPDHLVSDRHPLVETLVYLPLYRRSVSGPADGAALEPVVRERLAAAGAPGAYDAARRWHDLENRRLRRDTDFWALAADVVDAFAQPPDAILAAFGRRYGTTLPDVVVLLDVDAEEAARRVAGRGSGGRELHEDEQALTVLRDNYEVMLCQLGELRPGIELLRIANGGRGIDETLAELLDELALPAAPHAQA
jgi:predicted nucleic acid-binding protein